MSSQQLIVPDTNIVVDMGPDVPDLNLLNGFQVQDKKGDTFVIRFETQSSCKELEEKHGKFSSYQFSKEYPNLESFVFEGFISCDDDGGIANTRNMFCVTLRKDNFNGVPAGIIFLREIQYDEICTSGHQELYQSETSSSLTHSSTRQVWMKIEFVATHPAYTNRGVGKWLMTIASAAAVIRKTERCLLYIAGGSNNERAHHLYLKIGFESASHNKDPNWRILRNVDPPCVGIFKFVIKFKVTLKPLQEVRDEYKEYVDKFKERADFFKKFRDMFKDRINMSKECRNMSKRSRDALNLKGLLASKVLWYAGMVIYLDQKVLLNHMNRSVKVCEECLQNMYESKTRTLF